MISKIINYNHFINLNVLRPITPYNLDINYNIISLDLKNYIKSRLNYYEDTPSKNWIIESEFSEFWFKKASDGKRIGGNKGMDIITKNNLGLDLSCLYINGNQTNVKSIISYYDMDKNFDLAKNKLHKKIDNFCMEYNTKELFYCVLISDEKNIYLSTFQFYPKNIPNIYFNNITKNSVYTNNFIDSKYGYVKLNLRQRRLELRLNSNIINKFNTIKLL